MKVLDSAQFEGLNVLNRELFTGRFSYWDDAIPFPAGIPRQTAAPGD